MVSYAPESCPFWSFFISEHFLQKMGVLLNFLIRPKLDKKLLGGELRDLKQDFLGGRGKQIVS